jgi:hypothetical protein
LTNLLGAFSTAFSSSAELSNTMMPPRKTNNIKTAIARKSISEFCRYLFLRQSITPLAINPIARGEKLAM